MTGGALFDFDGTLVDTFDDIVEAVQRMRAAFGAAPLSAPEVRGHIGWGTPNLIGQCHPELDALRGQGLPADGSPLPIDEGLLQRSLALFRQAYDRVLLRSARPYPGMARLCARLAGDGLALAVVSNKPEIFTRRILAALGLADPFRAVVGGDTLAVRKPDPAPLAHAARTIGLPLARCVMVGDGPLDIQAARAAGVPCCAVSWGIQTPEELARQQPAAIVCSDLELERWIRRTLRAPARSAARPL
ncbi:MAG: HAD-IA family hydrolase [Candidatus Eisenbacteria bacterium]|uniref:HAD-IA family hydrolase n=1 Tax=Eiseniibacteriota bacterium TaxID=2212470 RepID=A0A937XA85_UNCEI|nr:HAD-IA family hydrolase [Candidatus Eisenbacteria bacterium]